MEEDRWFLVSLFGTLLLMLLPLIVQIIAPQLHQDPSPAHIYPADRVLEQLSFR